MKMRAGEIEIAYDARGSGTPLVLLHGFPHDRRLWAPQLSSLADHAYCIAPDLRGFGASTVATPFTVEQYADDIAALLGALLVERAVIAGLSMGGYIAFALWRRHPALVRALLLLDTKAEADTDEQRAKRREQIAMVRAKGSAALAEQLIDAQLGETTRARNEPVKETVQAMMAAAPVDGVVGALEAMMARPDSTPTLATISVPTLIVVGAEDTVTPPALSESMHAAIRGSRLEVIAGAGHLSGLERPSAVNRVITDFVEHV